MENASFTAGSDLTPSEVRVVTEFVKAVNQVDLQQLVTLFAPDAQVNDQLRNFWGRDAIAGWLAREVVAVRLQIGISSVRKHRDVVILDTEITGEFDSPGMPGPLHVDMYISVRDEQIVRLLILIARSDEDEPEIRRLV